jgi:protein gp37
MAENSKIEWTDATWNPITGCSVVSPGCTNCYAMRLAGTRLHQHPSRAGLTKDSKAGPVWTGEVRFNRQWLDQPLNWKRPRRIFVCAHGDLFHESVPDEWIDQVFAIMAAAHWHTFQVLTKRADRMAHYLREHGTPAAERWVQQSWRLSETAPVLRRLGWSWAGEGMPWPLPNVWLGVSAEDQKRADERIPHLKTGGCAPPPIARAATATGSAAEACNGVRAVPARMTRASAASTGSWPAARAAPARGRCTRPGRAPSATSARRRGWRSS